MMIPKETKWRTLSGSFFLAAVSIFIYAFFSLTLTAQPADKATGSIPNASDDEVYKAVMASMYLQYDLTPGWVPSDTDKAALCLWDAVCKYGKNRVEKWIIKWAKNLPVDHMTLITETLTEIQIDTWDKALIDGRLTPKSVAEYLIASATVKTSNIQQRNKQ